MEQGDYMITINGQQVKANELFSQVTNKEQKTVLNFMEKYNGNFHYHNFEQLKFELQFRSNTMNAARQLDKSGGHFTTFEYAFCNRTYWDRLSNGGFLLKPMVSPSVAILDTIKNGKLYAYDCSTAIAIVLYLAALYSIGSERFDYLFDRLYLMDWKFDEDLQMIQLYGDNYLPGDVLHFNNPDFNPREPHWRAENVIFFGNDQYYGHGIGIRNASTIIDFLNNKRKPNPQYSAYLMRLITRPYYQSFLQ
jgi:protein-glutamine gamma-glutamyltransferase